MSSRFGGLMVAVACIAAAKCSVEAGESGVNQRRSPWTSSRVQGTPYPAPPYKLVPAFPRLSFTKPTGLTEIPGEDRLLVTEISGRVFSFAKSSQAARADLAIDLNRHLDATLRGKSISLFSAALHPKFSQNRFVYLCYVHPGGGGHTRVSRFTLRGNPPTMDAASEHVVITWPSGGHNAGCLRFGTDGYLYISTGDGSGPNPPDGKTTGQDVTDLLGTVLRIDVDRASGDRNYTVPSDNPFVNHASARPEIWAYGLRNPWKFAIDPNTNEAFVADNGWETWEMVHRLQPGGNCGWPIMEGRAKLRTEVPLGPTPIIPPVKDHPHSEANSVIGGVVYRGQRHAGLAGVFVYGDYITGTIWGLKVGADQQYTHQTLVDTDQRVIAFAEGSDGELFVLDYDFTGQIYELVPTERQSDPTTFPRRLSATGLFRDLKTMQPAAGVVPYAVRVNQWLDGATAKRWVAIPGDGTVALASAERSASYPEGTVFVRHIELPRPEGRTPVRLETQLLHLDDGRWNPYSYVWNDEGTEASLVDYQGADRALTAAISPDGQARTWRVGAENECRLCHNAGAGFVLGFVPNQLSWRPETTDTETQSAALVDDGVLASDIPIDDTAAEHLVDPHDEAQSLADRARSYLHANCSMCHHPKGNAIVSFYLRRDMPFAELNTNKGTGIGTFGMRNAKLIVPGDPYRSVLMYRMSKLGYGRMPYIGSQVVDSQGVALVEEWIRSLQSADTATSSGPVTRGSSEDSALRLLASDSGAATSRRRAIRELVGTTEGALAMMGQLHRGALRSDEHAFAVNLASQSSSRDIQGLFETFLPESQRRKRLGANIEPQTILSRTGDAARGRLIFFSDAARCRTCHDLTDRNKSTGPTIAEIRKKYPRRSEMLQHILQPSQKIEDAFATFAVATTQGRVISGLVIESNDQRVVVKTAEGRAQSIPRSQVDEMTRLPTSLMPERILSDLTAQEAADLLAFIMAAQD